MSFTKFASLEKAEVLGIKGSSSPIRTASLDKFADFEDYRTEDGYLYARIRAISSRVNKNHDGWPSVELAGGEDAFNRISKTARTSNFVVEAENDAKYGYSTFLGKPIFVDHHNSDPTKARGVIVDSKLHVEDHKTASEHDPYYASAPENHTPPTWVELLLEVDAKSFPKLATAIIEGSKDPTRGIDGFSMGCDVEKSVCNICKNAATTPDNYCEHVQLKGAEFPYTDPKTGKTSSRKSYEDCYGIKFFEISAVFDPADETALLREIRAHTSAENEYGRQSSTKVAEAPAPQVDLLKVPEPVDTLRDETVCPVCGSDMDEETCDVCGYTKPPDGFDNPDLTKAQERQQEDEQPQADPDETFGTSVPEGDSTSNNPSFAHVNNDMPWTVSTPHEAYTNPDKETPVVLNAGPSTDEPKKAVVQQDHAKPVTSQVRTAKDFLAAAGAQRRPMSQKTADAASGAPADAKPDKSVDTEGVGGVLDASNEEASKADAQVNVEGQGTTGVSDVAADSTESVDQGDEHSKNIEAIPTKTFGDGNSAVERQADPVSGGPYPSSGGVTSNWQVTAYDSEPYPSEDGGLSGGGTVKGTEPADPVGKPDERVDVLDSTTSPENNSGPTKTWSGTDGNKVHRQQDPVTTETLEGNDIVNLSPKGSSHILAAMKLADKEVELGLIESDTKYDRVAELEDLSPEALQAEARVVARVKTAGLSKATAKTATRMPPMGRNANVDTKESSETSGVEGFNPDSLLFLK